MAKFNTAVTNFLSGEVSPKAWGRVGTDRYESFCKEIQNCTNYGVGGVGRRPGSQFVRSQIAGTDFAEERRLIPFEFSKTEKYLIVLTTGTTTLYAIDVNNDVAYTLDQQDDASSPLEIFAGYAVGDLKDVQYCQSGDLLVLTHPDYPPIFIVRVTDASGILDFQYYCPWNINIGFTSRSVSSEGVPFRKLNTSSITLTPSVNWDTNGAKTLTASASLFNAGHVKMPFIVLATADASDYAICVVTAFTSTTVVTVNQLSNVGMAADQTAHATWYESAWSDYRGWPRAASFFQQRLCFGGNASQPDTVWCSQTGDVQKMTDIVTQLTGSRSTGDAPTYPAGADTDQKKLFYVNTFPFDFTLAANEPNQIQWLSGEKTLGIGTAAREYVAFGPDPSIGFGPFNIDVPAQSSEGSDYVQPVRMQNAAMFVGQTGVDVQEFLFNFDEDTAKASNIIEIAEHIPYRGIALRPTSGPSTPKIVNMQYAKNFDRILYAIDSNGILLSCTIDRDQKVYAWGYNKIAGSLSTETPKVLSIARLSNQRGDGHDLYMYVQRTINGSTKYFIERISKEFKHDQDNTSRWIHDKPVYMDACKYFRKYTGQTFYANFTSSVDAVSSGGSATGTASGSAAVSGGRLDLTGNTNKYVDYDGTSNVDTAQVGCIRFKLKFDYSGNPPADYHFFTICKADADTDNEISLRHDATLPAALILMIRDSGGTALINDVNLGVFYPVSGEEYWFELNYDLTTGATRLFINGKQFGATQTTTGTRDTSIDLLRIGSNNDDSTNADFYVDDFFFFSTVQNTADHSPAEYWDGTTALSGLDYLEGQSVVVVADGKFQPALTVASGAVTLAEAATELLVGLNYQNYVRLANLEAGSQLGVSQGAVKRYDKMTARLNRTIGFEYGRSLSDLKTIMFRDTSVAMGEEIPLFTGDKTFDFPGDYERDPDLYLAQSAPLPWQLTGLFVRGMANEG